MTCINFNNYVHCSWPVYLLLVLLICRSILIYLQICFRVAIVLPEYAKVYPEKLPEMNITEGIKLVITCINLTSGCY